MVFALVHFTVGFVSLLALASVVPITRYRLTVAYLGGVWALVPDVHHLVDGPLGERAHLLHESSRADLFFFHHALDSEAYRAATVELTALSLVVLGVALVLYDRRFGEGVRRPDAVETAGVSDESS